MSKSNRMIRFLKTTAIGGLLFLLPLIVLGALIGQIVPIVLSVAATLGEVIPVTTPGGIALLLVLAIAIVLLVCFGAGLAARRSFGQRISIWFEKNIVLLFPRYAVLRDQMAGTLGSDETKPKMRPVLVRLDDATRIAFEIERTDEGGVIVYLPGSPDPWSGKVVLLEADRVERLDVEFGEAAAACEQLGRGLAAILSQKLKRSPPPV